MYCISPVEQKFHSDPHVLALFRAQIPIENSHSLRLNLKGRRRSKSWTRCSPHSVCMQMTSLSSSSTSSPPHRVPADNLRVLSFSPESLISSRDVLLPSHHPISSLGAGERSFSILRATSKNIKDQHQRPTLELQTSVEGGDSGEELGGPLWYKTRKLGAGNPAQPPRRRSVINQSGAAGSGLSTNITAELLACSTCR